MAVMDHLFIKRTCPNCIQSIYPGDCDIVSVNIDPKTNTNKILVKAPESGLKRQYARINPQPIVGRLVLESAHRKCPHCGYLLPTNIEQVENINIAVVGDTFSGKSSYIAAIIRQIRQGDLQRADRYARFDCLTQDVESTYIREVIAPLFEQKQAPLATQPASPLDTSRPPLIYELILSPGPDYPARRINLILYDASGEDLAVKERMVQFSRYVLNASAIIFLADPVSMPQIFDQLPPFLQRKGSAAQGRTSSSVLNSIIRLVEDYRGVGAGARLSSTPIAINVTKSDLLKQLTALQYQYHFLKRPTYNGVVDLKDLDIVNGEVRHLLQEYGEHTLLQSTQNFSKVRFFATSATGYSPDSNDRYPAVEPCRCLDPILWILYEKQILQVTQ
ncbi:MAG: hypothetical protein H0U76_03595 [Ktedonobacteraceae bacterium]|nr:hypothetical protein [Ktedonobacteraceae bacterium]